MPYDKLVDSNQLNADLTSVANAIRTKGGTSVPLDFPSDFVGAIDNIPTGGGGVVSAPSKDVNFYDYDGTILHSYTSAEFAELTAMPENPTHDGLTSQGWNWTLADAKTHVTECKKLNIGQMYITDDGATRLHIRLENDARNVVTLRFYQSVADGVTIDWGDGSATETASATGFQNASHTYAQEGDYTISLLPSDGCKFWLGGNGSAYCVMGDMNNNNYVYCNMLKSVEVGCNVNSILQYTFQHCQSLLSITIPNSVTSIGVNAFDTCSSLLSITIPNSVTSVSDTSFVNCQSLSSVTMPNSVTSIAVNEFKGCNCLSSISIPNSITTIGNYAFSECHSLPSLTIPSSVTSVGGYAFNLCYGMAKYHFNPTAPPTLVSTNAFASIPSDCIIYVPRGSLNTYKTASNWSTFASYMQEEPQ